MSRKTGFQCLAEIKDNDSLKKIPVVIISTSYDPTVADGLSQRRIQLYPIDFSQLQRLISLANELVTKKMFYAQKKTTSYFDKLDQQLCAKVGPIGDNCT